MTEPREVVVAGASMPAAPSVVVALRAELEAMVREIRAERGDVHLPEDVFPGVLRLMSTVDSLDEYASAFRKIRGEAVAFIGDELEEAVGEQDGIPLAGLSVPDPDGTTVDVSLDAPNSYAFDTDALIKAVVAEVLAQSGTGELAEEGTSDLAVLMETAVRMLLELGSFTPGIRKVEAFKSEVARVDSKLASTITWTKTKNYKGIKVKREQPKARRTR